MTDNLEEDQEQPATNGEGVRRRHTTTMSDFFKVNRLDDSVKDLFLEYDKDGDGAFSKDEVMNIVTDLKKEFHKNETLMMSNLLLKKMLIGGVIFFFLLVGSIFGLSFAVASLTRETTVDSSSGALYNKDGTKVVATDSRAELHLVISYDFGDCISPSSIELMKRQVQEGKNVIVETTTIDGSSHKLEVLSPSGATFDEETGKACFPMPERPGTMYCIIPDGGACSDPENRRRALVKCAPNSSKPKCQQIPPGTGECCTTTSKCDSSDLSKCIDAMCIDTDNNAIACNCPSNRCCSGTYNEFQCPFAVECGPCT
jgi:hypothetical protein